MTQALRPLTIVMGKDRLNVFTRPDTSDHAVFVQVWERRVYQLSRFARGRDLGAVADRIRAKGKKPLIIDGGANIGASALYFASLGEDIQVLAIEPERENFELLRRNTAGNNRIKCIRAGLAPSSGTLSVFDPGKGAVGFRTFDDTGKAAQLDSVPAFSINDLLAAQTDTMPLIAKIDIEGAEGDLFSTNLEWVEKFPVLIVELHDWMLPGKSLSKNVLRCVADRGMDALHYGENMFFFRNPM